MLIAYIYCIFMQYLNPIFEQYLNNVLGMKHISYKVFFYCLYIVQYEHCPNIVHTMYIFYTNIF